MVCRREDQEKKEEGGIRSRGWKEGGRRLEGLQSPDGLKVELGHSGQHLQGFSLER